LLDVYNAVKKTEGYLLKYEDLVADPNAIQKEMAERFGFKYRGLFSQFHTWDVPERLAVTMNGVRQVDKGHDWRQHEARVQAQFKECPELHNMVKELGYEDIP